MEIFLAYFNAMVDESDPVYVELPPEIDAPAGSCALLRRQMYGTCRAADGQQSEYSGALLGLGCSQGTSSACVVRHAEWHIMISVHGDDFTCSGSTPQLQWLEVGIRLKYDLAVGA